MTHIRNSRRLVCGLMVTLALAAQSEDPRLLIQRAYSLQQAGDYAGAAEAYRSFLKMQPGEVGAHSNLGVVLVKLGRYNEAIEEYRAAYRLAPEDARIAVNLSLALEKSGRLNEAAGELEADTRAALVTAVKELVVLLNPSGGAAAHG